MKHIILTFSILLIALAADAQIIKGTGIIYFDSLTNVNASLPSGSEFAYSVKMKQFFRWDRDINEWVQAIEIPDTIAVFATQYYVDQLIQEVQDSLAAAPSGSGTTNTLAMWTSPEELGNSIVTQPAADVVNVTGTGGLKVPVGTTAQAPVGSNGILRFDNTINRYVGYNVSAYQPLLEGTLANREVGFADANGRIMGSSNLIFNTSSELIIGPADAGAYKLQNVNGASFFGSFAGNQTTIIEGSGNIRMTTNSSASIGGTFVNNSTISGSEGVNLKGFYGAFATTNSASGVPLVVSPDASGPLTSYRPGIRLQYSNNRAGFQYRTINSGGSIGLEWRYDNNIPVTDYSYTAARIRPIVLTADASEANLAFVIEVAANPVSGDNDFAQIFRSEDHLVLIGPGTTPTAQLDVNGTARIRTVAENTTSTKLAVLDANNVVGYRTFTPRAYAELYLDTTTDTLDITDTNLHTIIFDAQELASGMTATDSTLIVTTAGVYEINFSSTFTFTENNKAAPATFSLYVDDIEIGRGAMFSQSMHDNEEQIQSGHFTKKITLTATDILKIKVSGGGVTNSIQIHSATFGAQKID